MNTQGLTVLALCTVSFVATTLKSQVQQQNTAAASQALNSQLQAKLNSHPEITTIFLAGVPQGIAFTRGTAWVAYGDGEHGDGDDFGVARIDIHTNKLVTSIRTGKVPVGVAVGEGSVWVSCWDGNSVTRIDPETNRVSATIPVGKKPVALDFGEGSVWVANLRSNSISRIDPKTNAVVATISVGKRPFGVAVGDAAVWVANFESHSLSRIDPQTNSVSATVEVDGSPETPIAQGNDVWVTGSSQTSKVKTAARSLGLSLWRIDAKSNTVAANQIIRADGKAGGIAVSDGVLWVADHAHASISRIDARTNTISPLTISVGSFPMILGPGADENGAIWVSTSDKTVMKIKP